MRYRFAFGDNMQLIKRLCLVLVACLSLPPYVVAKPAPFIVEGYLPSIRGLNQTLNSADITPYSHIAIAFINPDKSGNLVAGDNMACMQGPLGVPQSLSDLNQAIDALHASGKKVIGSLGGAFYPPCSGDWRDLLSDAHRQNLIDNLVAFSLDQHLDGLDIDIEADVLAQLIAQKNYTPFVKGLKTALSAHQLSLSATTASYVGGMIPLESLPYLDYVTVMSYDNIIPGQEASSLHQFEKELYLWRQRGVDQDKLVMAMPFYGRGHGAYKTSYSYRDIMALSTSPASISPPVTADLIGTLCATCDYISFNGPKTIKEKTSLAKAKANGIAVWEISEDTPDSVLTKAMIEAINTQSRLHSAAKNDIVPIQTPNSPPLKLSEIEYFGPIIMAPTLQTKLPFTGSAVSLELSQATENNWDAGLNIGIHQALKANQVLDLYFWARLRAQDEDMIMDMPVSIETAKAPYATVLENEVELDTRWQLYHLTTQTSKDYPAHSLNIGLSLGNAAKTIELGPILLYSTH